MNPFTKTTRVIPMTPPQREASQGRDDDLKELWEDFRSSSTLHGFFRASEAKFSVRRITWLVALLAACVVLVLQLTNNIKEWRKYEVLYGTEIRNSHRLPFPAVSICNQNMMRKSKILGKNGQRYLDHLRSAWNESTEDEQSAPEAPFDVEKEIRAAGHQLSEMLIGCMFNMKPCSAEDFVPFLDFWHGLCYTFNTSAEINFVGPESALEIALDAQPDEYYKTTHEGTGFKVVVHDPNVLPQMPKSGISVAPGFTSDIKVRRKESYRLGPPYKSRCGSRPLVGSQFYSQTRCEAESFGAASVRHCGCYFVGALTNDTDTRACSTRKDVSCVTQLYFESDREESDCPLPCEEVQYSKRISTTYFPSRPMLLELLKRKKQAGHFDDDHYKLYSDAELENLLESTTRRSAAQIKVALKTLTTEVVREREAYSFHSIVADFGGNMGLFLGSSMLTLFEACDFLVLTCWAWLRRRKRPRHEPPDSMA